jgi:hypothetical protein
MWCAALKVSESRPTAFWRLDPFPNLSSLESFLSPPPPHDQASDDIVNAGQLNALAHALLVLTYHNAIIYCPRYPITYITFARLYAPQYITHHEHIHYSAEGDWRFGAIAGASEGGADGEERGFYMGRSRGWTGKDKARFSGCRDGFRRRMGAVGSLQSHAAATQAIFWSESQDTTHYCVCGLPVSFGTHHWACGRLEWWVEEV